MIPTPTLFAKLVGLRKTLATWLEDPRGRYFDPARVMEAFQAFQQHSGRLRSALPDLYNDLPWRNLPKPSDTTDNDGRGYIERRELQRLVEDIDYIFEVRAHSELAAPPTATLPRVFISHGRAEYWREVQSFIEKDLGIDTLELAQEPNLGRSVLQKLDEESRRCSVAVVVMSGDDQAGSELRARENVLHEIGFFQGKFGLASVCLLHEEGTNIPSNIHGLVYIPFPARGVRAAFGALGRELKAMTGSR